MRCNERDILNIIDSLAYNNQFRALRRTQKEKRLHKQRICKEKNLKKKSTQQTQSFVCVLCIKNKPLDKKKHNTQHLLHLKPYQSIR